MRLAVPDHPKLERARPRFAGKTDLVRRFYDDVLTQGSERAIAEVLAPNARISLPSGRYTGRAAVKRACAQLRSVFPDLRIEISDVITEGDQVTAEWRLCGTERREFLGVPPSGRWTCLHGLSFTRIAGDRIVEHRMNEG